MKEKEPVEKLIDALIGEITRHGFRRLRGVKLRVGTSRGLKKEAIRDLLKEHSAGTVLEGANVEVEEVGPGEMCMDCGAEVKASGPGSKCPYCGSDILERNTGDEFEVVSIDVE